MIAVPDRPEHEVFTTGKLARLFGVAPRTVSKWIDTGRLRGYRIPGGSDRRVTRAEVEKFVAEYGLPDPFAVPARSGRD